MRFFLGVHNSAWANRTDVPLFVSRSALKRTKSSFTRARGPWALDSGGFTEIAMHGRWTVTPQDYAQEVRLWQREVGNLQWAAPMDSMCEPGMLLRSLLADGLVDLDLKKSDKRPLIVQIESKYGKLGERFENKALLHQRVCVHQQRTIDNLLALREIAPDVPWAPVLQGWRPNDYLAHADAYMRAGVNLMNEPIVGLGSVCRRDKLDDARIVIQALSKGSLRLRLHGFGMKKSAFRDPVILDGLESSDSLAWSKEGFLEHYRRGKNLCGRKHEGGCQNCLDWALTWRKQVERQWRKTERENTDGAE